MRQAILGFIQTALFGYFALQQFYDWINEGQVITAGRCSRISQGSYGIWCGLRSFTAGFAAYHDAHHSSAWHTTGTPIPPLLEVDELLDDAEEVVP